MNFDNAIYLPAAASDTNLDTPLGGLDYYNEVLQFDNQYALLIDDVDTAMDANVTMALTVDKGLLILSGYDEQAASSPKVLKIAIAESNEYVRTFLENSLLALGHLVDTYMTGSQARIALQSKYEAQNIYPNSDAARMYDVIIMGLHYR